MAKARSSEESWAELDDIIGNEDADRLTEFLRRRHPPKKTTKTSVFEGFHIEFDFEVPLTKLNKDTQPAPKLPLRKSGQINNAATEENKAPSEPPPKSPSEPPPQSPTHENINPRSSSLSPILNRSPRRSGLTCRSGGVSGADRLRRSAIRRRSQSIGRRQLLKDFENLENVTRCSSSPNFCPTFSSTPSNIVANGAAIQTAAEAPETAAQIAQLREQCEVSFQQDLGRMDRFVVRPSSRLSTASHRTSSAASHRSSTADSSKRRTFTVEKGPLQGQLLLSPSKHCDAEPMHNASARTSFRQPVVRLRRTQDLLAPPPVPAIRTQIRRANTTPQKQQQEILAPNTPIRHIHSPARLAEPEVYVPETQPQEPLNETERLIKNLSKSSGMPMVVIPISCGGHLPTVAAAAAPPANTPAAVAATIPVAEPVQPPAKAGIKNSSMQTSNVPSLMEIMTDDETEDENEALLLRRNDSTAPLNLAPTGGNTTRQRRLRKRNYCPTEVDLEATTVLLNLHQANKNKRRAVGQQQQQKALPRLNKAPSAAINGEAFAGELARMSNYEILDLRKRNSMGKIYPLNGHQHQQQQQNNNAQVNAITEQRLALEQTIQWEILRRNLAGKGEGLPSNVSQPAMEQEVELQQPSRSESREESLEEMQENTREESRASRTSMLPPPPPADFRDSCGTAGSRNRSTRSSQEQPSRCSRSRTRQPPMTKEKKNYLALSQTMQERLKAPKNTQRSLYTKGDSCNEDNDMLLLAEEEQQQLRLSSIEIVPAPPMRRSYSSGAIAIVPPPTPSPPKSMRSKRTHSNEAIAIVPPPTPSPPKSMRSKRTHSNEAIAIVPPPTPSPPKSMRSKRTHSNEAIAIVPPPTPSPPKLMRSMREIRHSVRVTEVDLAVELPVEGAEDDIEPENSPPTPPPEFQTPAEPETASWHNSSSIPKSTNNSQLMEPLLMSTPADEIPAKASEAAVTEQQQQQLTDEQPSTSRLARKKLERSLKTTKATGQKSNQEDSVLKTTKATGQKSSQEDSVFKKPLAPAPRSKKPRRNNEINNLRITLVNETISQQDDDADTTLRRSKRGQVPLRNDWVHTVSDPLQFNFVRDQMYDQCIARAKQHRKEQRERSIMNSMIARKPLCSSTPRSTEPPPTGTKHTAKSSKRKRSPQQQMEAELQFSGLGDTDICDGIAPLNDITERDEELAVEDAPKKSDRNKKSQEGKQVEQPESEPDKELAVEDAPKKSDRNKKSKKGKQVEQQESEPDPAQEQPTTSKKGGRNKKIYDKQQPELQSETAPEQEPEQEQEPAQEQQKPEQPTTSKKKGRKRKIEDKQQPKQQNVADPEPEQEQPAKASKKRGKNNKVEEQPEMQQLLVEEEPPAAQPEEELVPLAPPSPTPSVTVNEHHQSTAANGLSQLMDWLRGDGNAPPNRTASFNDAQLQSMRILSAGNLRFSNMEDIDYAFYDTEDKATSGYMRFKPLQQRGAKRAKSYNLYFIVVYGEFAIDSSANATGAMECSVLYTGDMAEIKKGTRYAIQNRLDEVSVLMVFRK